MTRLRNLAIAASTLAIAATVQPRPVLVGVLEEPQCMDSLPRIIRVLFQRTPSGWDALTQPPASATSRPTPWSWNVAFDGRTLGTVATIDSGFHSQYAWTYPRDHFQWIQPRQALPRVGNRARAFGGWCSAPKTRPLVVVSDTNYRDPQRWRPFKPDASYRRALYRRFRASIDSVFVCPRGPDSAVRWHFLASDLVYAKSYADSLGNKLIALGLPPAANNCGDLVGAEWASHWYFVGADTLFLGAELDLVDAGDYDADGQSEVIFWHSGYDEDGYSLFYRQFHGRTDFFWIYH